MNKKISLFSDQSSSSRIDKIKQEALQSGKKDYVEKNNTDTNVGIKALAKLRGSGYVVPPKVYLKNI
jgi:hypothetical protein